MTTSRAKAHAHALAERLATRLAEDSGEHGMWIIVNRSGFTWWGFFGSRREAVDKNGARDSEGIRINGTVVQVP